MRYELLPPGKIIESNLYCQQITGLQKAIEKNRPELANEDGVVLHYDYGTAHISLTSRQKLREHR